MTLLVLLKKKATSEKKAFAFLLKLLILLTALKCIFFIYNYNVGDGWRVYHLIDVVLILKWSLIYDGISIACINCVMFVLLFACGRFFKYNFFRKSFLVTFSLANTFLILLNTVDIFYYRFHLQRADADLVYVLRNPFDNGTTKAFLILSLIVLYCSIAGWLLYKSAERLTEANTSAKGFVLANLLLLAFIGTFFLTGTKKQLPTYPLTEIDAIQLPLVQNSFHSFIYSIYRRQEALLPRIHYMTSAKRESLFSIRKKSAGNTSQKNIILFIMESVPLDFFDKTSPYKVYMPFLDSLVNKSTFFSNAFSYSYNSNKGITAILGGLPTITDIPLYHSNYTSLHKTSLGSELAKKNYNSSFFIGDNYDDFGFAKCCKWLGIQHYFCMQDIPGHEKMEKHTMGLHDEYVLHFMQQKLANLKQPFFAAQYNISTHYPNDIPSAYIDKSPTLNLTGPMKSMQYYNDCLKQFFEEAKSKPWYKNTVFIFCSDHWAQPHAKNIKIDQVESFRIPLFIYDPSKETHEEQTNTVSQLDILNTILHYANIGDSITSYGEDLTDTLKQKHRAVFTKINGALYQAINDQYVLGFDAMEGREIYCYDFINDPDKKNNLLIDGHPNATINNLSWQMKAFLQTSSDHYRNNHNN